MKKKVAKNQREKVVLAALRFAAEKGWPSLTFADLAAETKISLDDLYEGFSDKSDILVELGRMIDRQVLEAVALPSDNETARERLFDILMERYETLNQYREGLCAILDSFRGDPKQAVISLPYLCRSMTWMLEAAGIETGGFRGAIRVTGLTGIYLKTLRTWRQDETIDLSRTMAELDKNLNRAEQAANSFGL